MQGRSSKFMMPSGNLHINIGKRMVKEVLESRVLWIFWKMLIQVDHKCK